MTPTPDRFSDNAPLAVKPAEARRLLGGISAPTLWRLVASGRLRKTSYGTFRVSDLVKHLEAETK